MDAAGETRAVDTAVERDFDSVFPELYRDALSVARRLLPSLHDAEDAAAEALARTLVRWEHVRRLPYWRAWVLRVTTNVAIDMLRRRRPGSLGSRVEPPTTDDADRDIDDRAFVVALLGGLPRRQREVLALRHLGGFDERETAAAMRISVNSVKTHLLRGMQAVRATAAKEDRP